MTKYKKPTYIIIQEAMAEHIRFLEDELYEVTINLKSSWITNGSRCKVRQHS
ncbi:TPA: hypothetical protein ACOQEQ_001374 [Streptococcus pneumoniae]